MRFSNIIERINKKLAGEMLEYNELDMFLDEVVDDINSRLNSCYPAFSEIDAIHYPDHMILHTNPDGTTTTIDKEYDFFPERYIRSVVVVGAAYKFYLNDEEGMDTAQAYGFEYKNALFEMQRDFIEYVPERWRTDPISAVNTFTDEWFEPHSVDFWGNV
jgi:hypothetical protein